MTGWTVYLVYSSLIKDKPDVDIFLKVLPFEQPRNFTSLNNGNNGNKYKFELFPSSISGTYLIMKW